MTANNGHVNLFYNNQKDGVYSLTISLFAETLYGEVYWSIAEGSSGLREKICRPKIKRGQAMLYEEALDENHWSQI